MALPGDVLAKLSSLSGYDQMLEMDAVSRNFGISLGDIESQIRAYQSNQGHNNRTEIVDSTSISKKELVDLGSAQSVNNSPTYIDNPDNYRLRYDPSARGQSNQSMVNQAIICPTCSAPLGIPNVRPIKVTCPQCMDEIVFNS